MVLLFKELVWYNLVHLKRRIYLTYKRYSTAKLLGMCLFALVGFGGIPLGMIGYYFLFP